MGSTVIRKELLEKKLAELGIVSLSNTSIREIRKLTGDIEAETGISFVKMEMGIPGLPAPGIGIDAEKRALDGGAASLYPPIDGIPELKQETARFCKLFMDIDVKPEHCFPSVGSMHGGFSFFMVAGRMRKERNKVLFIDPGFPVHKQLIRMIGLGIETFDVYDYRGDKLRPKLENFLSQGDVSVLLYSNPNNPTWISFTDRELSIIGELCEKYDVIAAEDLAYFAMDFRNDLSVPGKPPFQPTVAQYTRNYVQFISSSKVYSYAGQRIGMLIVSPDVFERRCPDLTLFYPTDRFGHSLVFGTLYATTAGTAHSAQYGLAAMLKATNDGAYKFLEPVKEYGAKAKIMKKYFTDNGFTIVYDRDEDKPLADGFYFTIAYPGMEGEELLRELVLHGISAIALGTTGSEHTEGMRACVSFVGREQFPDLKQRLELFRRNHPGQLNV